MSLNKKMLKLALLKKNTLEVNLKIKTFMEKVKKKNLMSVKNPRIISHLRVISYHTTVVGGFVNKKAYLRPAFHKRYEGEVFFTLPLLIQLQSHKHAVDRCRMYDLYKIFKKNPLNHRHLVLIVHNKTRNMVSFKLEGVLRFIYQNRNLFRISITNLYNLINATEARFGKIQNLTLLYKFLFKHRHLMYNNRLFLSNPYIILCGWDRNLALKIPAGFTDFFSGHFFGILSRPNSHLLPLYKNKAGKTCRSKFNRRPNVFIETRVTQKNFT
jgi:hypothetical protein